MQDNKPDEASPSWSLLGAITVLEDLAISATASARALVIFSPGPEGTSITPQDPADQGIAANAPIYPVALPSNQFIWYGGEMIRTPFQPGRCPAEAAPRLPRRN